MTPLILSSRSRPCRAQLAEDLVGVLAVVGAPGEVGRRLVELQGRGRPCGTPCPISPPPRGCSRWRGPWGSTRSSAGRLYRRPHALGSSRMTFHSSNVFWAKSVVEERRRRPASSPRGPGVDEARVVDSSSGRAEQRHQVAPVAIGLQHDERDEAPVRGAVRCRRSGSGCVCDPGAACGHAEEPGGQGRGAGGPHGRGRAASCPRSPTRRCAGGGRGRPRSPRRS